MFQTFIKEMQDVYSQIEEMYNKFPEDEKPIILNDMIIKMANESVSIDKAELDEYVNNLLSERGEEVRRYLLEERKITTDMIVKYRIGMKGRYNQIIFPQFDENGNLINMKGYQPNNKKFKWMFLYKGRG